MKPTALDYFNGKHTLPENAFRIGASSFSTFISRPWQFFKENVLNIGGFEGSTSSVIGTICHFVCEQKAQGKEPSLSEINQYIANQSSNPDVDAKVVNANWKPMAVELVNSYVLPNLGSYTAIEEFVTFDLGNDIYIGGSIDALQGDTIVDYKTTSSKAPSSIPSNYKQQLLVYAWVLKQLNRPMERIRLVYVNRPIDTRRISEKTGKPIGKLTLPEVTVLTEIITQEDISWIESMIYLARDKLLATEQYPELRNVIWHGPSEYWGD